MATVTIQTIRKSSLSQQTRLHKHSLSLKINNVEMKENTISLLKIAEAAKDKEEECYPCAKCTVPNKGASAMSTLSNDNDMMLVTGRLHNQQWPGADKPLRKINNTDEMINDVARNSSGTCKDKSEHECGSQQGLSWWWHLTIHEAGNTAPETVKNGDAKDNGS